MSTPPDTSDLHLADLIHRFASQPDLLAAILAARIAEDARVAETLRLECEQLRVQCRVLELELARVRYAVPPPPQSSQQGEETRHAEVLAAVRQRVEQRQ